MAISAPKAFGFLIATITARHHFFLTLLLRIETLIILIVIGGFLFYTRWLTARYRPLMRGQRLQHCALIEKLKFTPPKFIDLGFSNIPKNPGGTWRVKHENFSFFASCGSRPYMEDRMHYMNDPHQNLSIFSIFDGHGGPFVSQYLEENFSNAIRSRLLKSGPDARRLSNAVDAYDTVTQAVVTEVHNIDDAISRLNPSLTSFTGSTLISVILERKRFLTVVNVGDSRAVACDSMGRAIALSADHKPSNRIYTGKDAIINYSRVSSEVLFSTKGTSKSKA
ncbi:Protein phosphatase 1L [Toxocara canis]|uniref:Protein phosphatase 1L n=1 Tax=Toxocara canis TaxID=6265 RepID=A0A0B2V807_TOXCA|nr:Protein phosphatase 1L [Toxocara canis]